MATNDLAQIARGTSKDRIPEIDILRGFALFGVILVNIFYFPAPAAYASTDYEQFGDVFNRDMLRWMSRIVLTNLSRTAGHVCSKA